MHVEQDESPAGTALVIIDMLSTWDFPDGSALLRQALAIAPAIARLKRRCQAAGVPVIYANDNHGRWRSDHRQLVQEALEQAGPGAGLTRLLKPADEDYFVLKPLHNAFFGTPLELLLRHLKLRHLLITGVASDQCVAVTAAHAHMREYQVVVPRDTVASLTAARNRAALLQFEQALNLRTTPAPRLRLPLG